MGFEFFASGTKPLATDTIRVLEEKILIALNNGGGGGGGGGGGSGLNTFSNLGGNPPGAAPTSGAFSVDSSTGNGWMGNGSAWVQLF